MPSQNSVLNQQSKTIVTLAKGFFNINQAPNPNNPNDMIIGTDTNYYHAIPNLPTDNLNQIVGLVQPTITPDISNNSTLTAIFGGDIFETDDTGTPSEKAAGSSGIVPNRVTYADINFNLASQPTASDLKLINGFALGITSLLNFDSTNLFDIQGTTIPQSDTYGQKVIGAANSGNFVSTIVGLSLDFIPPKTDIFFRIAPATAVTYNGSVCDYIIYGIFS